MRVCDLRLKNFATPKTSWHNRPSMNYEEEQSGVTTVSRNKIQRPQRYQVLMHNDDYTTKEFVVFVLQTFFQKSVAEAQSIMLQVHNMGVGLCGVYTRDIAESKIFKVTKEAKRHGHPLLCTCEPES